MPEGRIRWLYVPTGTSGEGSSAPRIQPEPELPVTSIQCILYPHLVCNCSAHAFRVELATAHVCTTHHNAEMASALVPFLQKSLFIVFLLLG
jgi:hypothetical protein